MDVTLNIHHFIHTVAPTPDPRIDQILNILNVAATKENHFMADITAQYAQIKTDLDAVKADLASATTGITGLSTQVADLSQSVKDLQAQLANAGLTPEQQQALTDLVAEADDVKTSSDSLAAQFTPATPPQQA